MVWTRYYGNNENKDNRLECSATKTLLPYLLSLDHLLIGDVLSVVMAKAGDLFTQIKQLNLY